MSKSKGLGNPIAIAAASTGTEMAIKGAPNAVKAAGRVGRKVNEDTKGSMSWLLLIGMVAGVYTVWKITAPLRAGAGAIGSGIDAIGGAFSGTPAPGSIDNINVNDKPKGATITNLQAHTIAAGLLSNMDSWGKSSSKERQNIYALLLNKNAVDYQMISNAFGTPRRNPVTGEHAPPLLGFQMNLTEWLTAEIGSAGINFLRTITHGIF